MSFASLNASTMEPFARRKDKENIQLSTFNHKTTNLLNSTGLLPLKQKKPALKEVNGVIQKPRKALGNLSNVSKSQLLKSPKSELETLKKPKLQLSRCYPDIEKMPNSLEVEADDYEDIWPKSERLSPEEMHRLARWIPRIHDISLDDFSEKINLVEFDPVPLLSFHVEEDWSDDLDGDGMFTDAILPVLLP